MKNTKETVIRVCDMILAKLDSLLSGKQNVIFKTDLNQLRNEIVEIQEMYE